MNENDIRVILTAYGNKDGVDKGIVFLCLDMQKGTIRKEGSISLSGKANMVIEHGDELITSVQDAEESNLVFYDKSGVCKHSDKTDLFYSYGQVVGDKMLLASYASGADSVYDLKEHKLVRTVLHRRDDYDKPGKSHYIHQLEDGRVVAVENALQQIYIYHDIDLLEMEVLEYPTDLEKNIRLLSFHPNGKMAYLNTEFTNELLVLETDGFRVLRTNKMCEEADTYSGGNAISEDGKLLAVSLRGKNDILIWNLDEDGRMQSGFGFKCGKIPRDLRFIGEYLLVCCTDENSVEVYRIKENYATKTGTVRVEQPITFSMK